MKQFQFLFASSLSTEIQTPKFTNGQSFTSFYSTIQIKIVPVSGYNNKLETGNKLVHIQEGNCYLE